KKWENSEQEHILNEKTRTFLTTQNSKLQPNPHSRTKQNGTLDPPHCSAQTKKLQKNGTRNPKKFRTPQPTLRNTPSLALLKQGKYREKKKLKQISKNQTPLEMRTLGFLYRPQGLPAQPSHLSIAIAQAACKPPSWPPHELWLHTPGRSHTRCARPCQLTTQHSTPGHRPRQLQHSSIASSGRLLLLCTAMPKLHTNQPPLCTSANRP
ncbi:hypothetical protein Taro_047364, partial [Colocasia esculenta]|nr:hypothetical protein [Colocasia esculenta]